MSFLKNDFPRIKVTGIGTGTWTVINVATLAAGAGVPFPVGTKNVKLKFDSVAALATTFGVRKKGSTDTFFNAANVHVKKDVWVELVDNECEFYLGTPANGEWYIDGFDSHFTFITTPVEKGGSTTSGTFTVDYSGDLPASAIEGTAIVELSRTVRIGAYGNVPIIAYQPIPRTQVLVPLDAARRIQYISGGGTTLDSDIRLVAWAPKGAVLHVSDYNVRNLTQSGQWANLPDMAGNTVLGIWRLYGTSDSLTWGMRPAADTSDTDTATGLINRYTYTRPSSAGYTEFQVGNVGVQAYYFGGIVGTLASAKITNIDKLVAGELSTITLDSNTFAVSTVKITDGQIVKVIPASLVSPGIYSFTPPVWIEGSTGLKYGSVKVFANDGNEDTAAFSSTLSLPSGYISEIIDTINAFSLPGAKINTQTVCNAAQAYVYKDGVVTNANGYSGTTNVWDRDPDDKITRFTPVNVVVGAGLPVVVNLTGLIGNSTKPYFDGLYPLGNRP